jgi:hypothetical protein
MVHIEAPFVTIYSTTMIIHGIDSQETMNEMIQIGMKNGVDLPVAIETLAGFVTIGNI